MSAPRALDVSELKSYALGSRDPMWWAVAGTIAIEATAFVLIAATYFYMKDNARGWPSQRLVASVYELGLLNAGVLLLSALPMWWAKRGAEKERLPSIQLGMVGVTVLCAAAAVLRWFELQALPFRWDTSAYGSIVWMIYGLHSFHLATSVVENAVFTALCFIGPFEKKHLVDVHVSANYYYFVVASWLPLLGLVLGDAWGGS